MSYDVLLGLKSSSFDIDWQQFSFRECCSCCGLQPVDCHIFNVTEWQQSTFTFC